MKSYTTKREYDRKADVFPAVIPIIQAGAFRMEICHATCMISRAGAHVCWIGFG